MNNSEIRGALPPLTASLCGDSARVYGHLWEGWSAGPIGGIKWIRTCSREQIRIRRIIKRGRMRPTGKFSSWKNSRYMHWESPNERNAFTTLDFSPQVIAYREQSCEIVYVDDDGNECRHYPDIEVFAVSGCELWEVKTKHYAESKDVKRRTEIVSESLAAIGIKYRMAIAEELGKQPQLGTMEKVLHFARRPVSSVERICLAQELSQIGCITWAQACSGRLGAYGREIICRLLLEGYLQIDLNLPFGPTTEFNLGSRGW